MKKTKNPLLERKKRKAPIVAPLPLEDYHISDNSVVYLEAEELEHDQSAFDVEVLTKMAYLSIDRLNKDYPELIFGHCFHRIATGKHDFKIKRSDGVVWADWKVNENTEVP